MFSRTLAAAAMFTAVALPAAAQELALKRVMLSSGGIGYFGMEVIDLQLGTGNDTLLIETTHEGLTLIDSGDGNDTISISSSSTCVSTRWTTC